jgi:hypothetical protein
LLASLADAYDAELSGVERQVTQAHALLAQIQAEIAESSRAGIAGHAGSSSPAAGDATSRKNQKERQAAELRAAETALIAGMQKRAREEMRGEWEATSKRLRLMETENAALPAADVASLEGLRMPMPAGSDAAKALAELKTQVAQVKASHSTVVRRFVERAREQGAGKQALAYRRLLAAGCGGGIAPDEVDSVVEALIDLLEDAQEPARGGANHSGSSQNADEGAGSENSRAAASLMRAVRG